MALGDSITAGVDDAIPPEAQDGYRGHFLSAFPDLIPVGSQSGPVTPNEGHPGFTSANTPTGILGNIATWWALNPAKYVLLHIGTNDSALGGDDAASAALSAANISDIVDYIHAQSPTTIIYVALIINARSDYVSLNPFIALQRPAVAAAMVGKTWVRVVDMPHTVGVDLADSQFSDIVHPNNTPTSGSGYVEMADTWIANFVP